MTIKRSIQDQNRIYMAEEIYDHIEVKVWGQVWDRINSECYRKVELEICDHIVNNLREKYDC